MVPSFHIVALVACCAALLQGSAWGLRPVPESLSLAGNGRNESLGKHRKSPFTSPEGLFIQERASKGLPGPGQHVNFGALVSWERIHSMIRPGRKLVLLIRHGQALSNWLQDYLGPDKWFDVETTCSYKDDDGKVYEVFDAELTDDGVKQAKELNALLKDSWFDTLTGQRRAAGIVSPLSRCLSTSLLALDGLAVQGPIHVEELCRETLGEDTCDARRSVEDPRTSEEGLLEHGPCKFSMGLKSKFPEFDFPVLGEHKHDFGLFHNKDKMWTKDREHQHHQTKRATKFLELVFERMREDVVVVVTHSGFTRSVLLAVGREPYRPMNTEVVPVLVEYRPRKEGESDEEGDDDVAEER